MVCLRAKPVVDGLQRQYADSARVLRVDLRSRVGRQIGDRYEVDTVPSVVAFDAKGEAVFRSEGQIPIDRIRTVFDGGRPAGTPP